jgi:hypothetical protein
VHSAQGVKLQNPDARGHERRQSISLQLLPSQANRAPTTAAHPPRADRHAVQSCTPYMKVHECASLILKKNIHPARNAGWLPDVCISLTGFGSCWPHHLFPALYGGNVTLWRHGVRRGARSGGALVVADSGYGVNRRRCSLPRRVPEACGAVRCSRSHSRARIRKRGRRLRRAGAAARRGRGARDLARAVTVLGGAPDAQDGSKPSPASCCSNIDKKPLRQLNLAETLEWLQCNQVRSSR